MKTDAQPTIFEEKEVRRVWHEEQWYFSIIDVIAILTNSTTPKRYWSDLKRKLNSESGQPYEKIVRLAMRAIDGRVRETDCLSTENLLRVIQSIPSPKAEPFKLWLARVGYERIEELQDPELAIVRAKRMYEQKGYSDEWIAKRMRGINIRNTLTDEWKDRGAIRFDFAALTNEIYKGAFELDAKQIKEHKSLSQPDNPRDHMSEMELILTMLGEATTTEITTTRDSMGLPQLTRDAKEGGEVAGRTRKDIEAKIGKKVVTRKNFKDLKRIV